MAVDSVINTEIFEKVNVFLTANSASQDDCTFVLSQLEKIKTLNLTDAFGVIEEDIHHFSDNIGTAATANAIKSYTVCAQNEPRTDKSRQMHIFMGISNNGSRKVFHTVSLDDINNTSIDLIKDIKYKQPKCLRILQVSHNKALKSVHRYNLFYMQINASTVIQVAESLGTLLADGSIKETPTKGSSNICLLYSIFTLVTTVNAEAADADAEAADAEGNSTMLL